jgi:hypothetical protein
MRRNVGGQFIGAQLIAKADGTPITSGTTTVYVTGDAGTQAAGSVSAGAATHEGNGYWTYAPAQAETNYTQVAFTFVNTNAINATIQVYPLAYDASGQFTGVTVGTNNDKTAYSIASGGITAASFAAGAIDAAAIATDAIGSAELAASAITEIQSGLSTLDAAGIRTAIGLSSANLDTQLSTIDDFLDTEIAAIKAKTDNLPSGIQKNTALSNFEFFMVDSTDHITPKTGLTITSQRSIDGAAFASTANTAAEVSNGLYKINLAAADLNGDVITLRFSSTGADDRVITIVTDA